MFPEKQPRSEKYFHSGQKAGGEDWRWGVLPLQWERDHLSIPALQSACHRQIPASPYQHLSQENNKEVAKGTRCRVKMQCYCSKCSKPIKGFAGITTNRATPSQPSQGRETALREGCEGRVMVIWQVWGLENRIRERTESNVTDVPPTGGALGEEGQGRVQRRKCYGLVSLALQP